MPIATPALHIVDQLSEVRALVECAFMACAAIDDCAQGNALQSLLNLIDGRLEDLRRQASPVLLAAA